MSFQVKKLLLKCWQVKWPLCSYLDIYYCFITVSLGSTWPVACGYNQRSFLFYTSNIYCWKEIGSYGHNEAILHKENNTQNGRKRQRDRNNHNTWLTRNDFEMKKGFTWKGWLPFWKGCFEMRGIACSVVQVRRSKRLPITVVKVPTASDLYFVIKLGPGFERRHKSVRDGWRHAITRTRYARTWI